MNISLNDSVQVVLTPEGEKIYSEHRAFIDRLCGRAFDDAHEQDNLGRRKFLLWELMQIFGKSIEHGGLPPFVDCNLSLQWRPLVSVPRHQAVLLRMTTGRVITAIVGEAFEPSGSQGLFDGWLPGEVVRG